MNISEFDTIIFDCDGVLLNSNKIKEEAIYHVSREYGQGSAEQMVVFHREHGGISRYEKFQYLHDVLLEDSNQEAVKKDIQEFESYIEAKLQDCEICEGVESLLESLAGKDLFVSSGGNEVEVRNVLVHKKLDHFFVDIFGSPDKKSVHLNKIKKSFSLENAVFIGDSSTDYKVAKQFELDFIFVEKYSLDSQFKMDIHERQIRVHSLNSL